MRSSCEPFITTLLTAYTTTILATLITAYKATITTTYITAYVAAYTATIITTVSPTKSATHCTTKHSTFFSTCHFSDYETNNSTNFVSVKRPTCHPNKATYFAAVTSAYP